MSDTSAVGIAQVGDLWVSADDNTTGTSAAFEQLTTVPSIAAVIPGFGFGGAMVMSATVPSISAVITGSSMLAGMNMFQTVPSIKQVFGGDALLPSSTGTTVFFQGVDRTAYCSFTDQAQIQGSMQVQSLGNCTIPFNNTTAAGGYRTTWFPSKFDEVAVYLGVYKLFGGYVNTVERTMYSGGLQIYLINCWSYGAILDRVIVGTHFELYDGALANIIMFSLVSRYLASRGYIWGGSGGETGPLFPPFTINWWSFSQICQYVTAKANWSYYVDQYKVLRMFGIASIVRPSPFTLSEDNSIFETLKPVRGGEYYNYVIVRNSQSLGSIWTDTFAGDANSGSGFYAPLTGALTAKPVVLVNGVAQVVTDPGVYGHPWDFYWLAFGVVRNPALSPLIHSDVVDVLYPSDLDYITIAKDDGEIATYGQVMRLIEIKGLLSLSDQQILADGYLALGIADITTLEAQTDLPGIEPGQICTLNAAPYSGDFMVEQVDFVMLNQDRYRFTVKASNANVQRRDSGTALFQRLLTQALQPPDRIQTPIGFALFVTVAGSTNPGSTTGTIAGAIRTCPGYGVAVKCTLNFQSASTTPTTVDVIIDVLLNGSSIFPSGSPAKMIFPSGATTPQEVFIFLANPQQITSGAVVTLNCIQSDPLAYDGVLELTVQVNMALGPLVTSIPDGQLEVPYTYQVQQSDVIFTFTSFFGPAANLPPYDFTFLQSGPYPPGIRLADLASGLAIPGMVMSSTGLISGTPTVAGNYVPIIMPISALNPSPPPNNYSVDTVVVNGWAVISPGNRSYPIF